MTVRAKKLEADGQGQEKEIPMSAMLDVAVFPEADDDLGDNDLPVPLAMERHEIVTGEQTFTFNVKERPARVGIDPYIRMIDRNPDDNLKSL